MNFVNHPSLHRSVHGVTSKKNHTLSTGELLVSVVVLTFLGLSKVWSFLRAAPRPKAPHHAPLKPMTAPIPATARANAVRLAA